jgi:UDP-N-acetylglucosamine transferase subunit ALG13
MDNHQEELARALKEKHYLEYCLPKVGHPNPLYTYNTLF